MGEVNVFAEVMATDSRDIDDIVERYEPNYVHALIERRDRMRVALRPSSPPGSERSSPDDPVS